MSMRDFSDYIVASGAATQAEVDVAIERQRMTRPTIGRLALTKGLLSGAQIFSVLAYQTRNQTMRFGEAAIALGMLAPRHVEELLWEQRVRTTPIEELLVRAGVIELDVARSLRKAFDGAAPVASVPRPSGIQSRRA